MRPRRLTPMGRMVIGAYVLVAAATAAWLMHDLPMSVIVLAAVIGVPIAIGASAYGRHLVMSR